MIVGLDVSAVPPDPRGAGRFIVELARALQRRGNVDLRLQARRDDEARWHSIAPGAEVRAIVPASRPMRLAWEQVAAPRRVNKWGVDVYHGPHYTIPELAKVPKVVTVHDVTFYEHPEAHEKVKVAFFTRAIKAAGQLATIVVCDSRSVADRLAIHQPPRCPVEVIPLAVDHDLFRPDAGEDADRSILDRLGVTSPYVLFGPATFEPRKGIEVLVRAFELVAPARPDLRLVLAGGAGWGSASIEQAITASPVVDRIIRPGYVPDDAVPALMRRAEVVAYPSLDEGFGFPALEAMACGAPLITTAGTCMEEITGDAAWLVPPADHQALATAIESALDDQTLRTTRIELGRRRAATYTWDATAAGYEAVYDRAAHRLRST